MAGRSQPEHQMGQRVLEPWADCRFGGSRCGWEPLRM